MGTEADLHAQLLAVQGTPTAAVVRVASAERLRVGRTLDMGADGLMIPRLETADEIAETLTWMRYPPVGIRGVALGTRGGGYSEIAHGNLAATVNDRVLGVFQVESGPAVEASEATAAIDGVDVLFVGPGGPLALARGAGPVRRARVRRGARPGRRRVPGERQGGRDPAARRVRASRPRSPRGSRSSGSARTRRSWSRPDGPASRRRAPRSASPRTAARPAAAAPASSPRHRRWMPRRPSAGPSATAARHPG